MLANARFLKPASTENEFYPARIEGLPVCKWQAIIERYAG
jgi:hypothetical protein